MRSALVLLLLTGLGVALLVVNPMVWGFPTGSDGVSGIFLLWKNSLEAFAIPVSLLIVNMTKGRVVRGFKLAWSLWLLAISALLLVLSREAMPGASPYGVLFVGAVLVLSLSCTLFSTIEITRLSLKDKAEKDPPKNPQEKPVPTPPSAESVTPVEGN